MKTVQALVLRTAGTNCDLETAQALRMAGAQPHVLHINQLISGKRTLNDFQIMVIPGGFSYGDDIAAGKILANELRFKLANVLDPFVASGRKVIGICNGFQVLVKAGYLPGTRDHSQTVTLASNDSGQFQCHWVRLKREKSACQWLNETEIRWELPIAHGEGKFVARDAETLAQLEKNGQIVFRYQGSNPNGSTRSIAGICNARGNVVGLMPHPERHVRPDQHPDATRVKKRSRLPVGFQFFKAAIGHTAKS